MATRLEPRAEIHQGKRLCGVDAAGAIHDCLTWDDRDAPRFALTASRRGVIDARRGAALIVGTIDGRLLRWELAGP